MLKRINEINQILNERNAELETCEDAERIEAINSEITQLAAEKRSLVEKRRKQIQDTIANGTDVDLPAQEEEHRSVNTLKQMNMRQKLSFALGKISRGKSFDEAEKRALSALTTTATEFTEATTDVEGINNGGVFIKTNSLFDLLIEEKLISGLVADITFTSIPGKIEYLLKERKTKAQAKAEGKGNSKDNNYKWTKLSLQKGWLQASVRVTDELKALSDFEVGAYLLGELVADFDEDFSYELIYATGEKDDEDLEHIKGVTAGAKSGTYTDYTQGVITALTSLPKNRRKGAKVYIAQDVYDGIFFSLDANGNFKYPVFNNATGITSIGTARIVLDEILEDGHIIAGNVSKYYKANTLIPINVENDRDKKKKIDEYIVSTYLAAAPVTDAFVHYKKK